MNTKRIDKKKRLVRALEGADQVIAQGPADYGMRIGFRRNVGLKKHKEKIVLAKKGVRCMGQARVSRCSSKMMVQELTGGGEEAVEEGCVRVGCALEGHEGCTGGERRGGAVEGEGGKGVIGYKMLPPGIL